MRKPAVPNKPRIAKSATFAAATGGWVANQNLAQPDRNAPQGAFKLRNMFPTSTSNILRRGSQRYATVGDGSLPVESLMAYKNGNIENLFAATNGAIYDVTNVVDPLVSPAPDVSGLTSGKWSSAQFTTTGGAFLVNVNASDPMQIYDGSDWYAITNEPVNRLNFDAQTANFTVGATITGATSGTTAVIKRQVDNGASGYLILGTITGSGFQDNEIISGGGGSASVNGAAQTLFVALTGVATNALAYVWPSKARLFFIEENSMNAWYLAADSIGGVAKKLPLGGEFTRGGSLMYGASWSLDSGNGLHDTTAFFSTEGEVLIYEGIDPTDATTWQKVGIYRIGKPLGPKAFIRAGGDLVIATDVGFVPLSQAIQRDYAALSPAAVSYPIETEWNNFVSLRPVREWNCEVWPESQMVVVALPTVNDQPATMIVSNARTGAWAEYTGWDGRCLELFNGRLFFGSTNGRVVEANVTGADEGAPYTGLFVPLFDDLRTPASLKIPSNGRVFLRGPRDAKAKLTMQFDYTFQDQQTPSAYPVEGSSEWGVGKWGEAVWGLATSLKTMLTWVSVSGTGYSLAPCAQITSGSTVPLDTEIIRIEITYDVAQPIT